MMSTLYIVSNADVIFVDTREGTMFDPQRDPQDILNTALCCASDESAIAEYEERVARQWLADRDTELAAFRTERDTRGCELAALAAVPPATQTDRVHVLEWIRAVAQDYCTDGNHQSDTAYWVGAFRSWLDRLDGDAPPATPAPDDALREWTLAFRAVQWAWLRGETVTPQMEMALYQASCSLENVMPDITPAPDGRRDAGEGATDGAT